MANIPVHILTGSLGSGKTTLLNAMLDGAFGSGTAVIVNEFGDVGLDRSVIQTASEEVVVLKNGCVCCAIRVDLATTLRELASIANPADPLARVVIETSGLSDPLPILQTISDDYTLRLRFRIGSVLCTVDALQPPGADDDGPEVAAQLAAADLLLVTKADLAGAAAGTALVDRLAAAFPDAAIVEGAGAAAAALRRREASPESRFSRRVSARAGASMPARSHGVDSIVLREAAPTSWPAFAVWLTRLLHLHGDRILRCKGVLHDRERDLWIGVHGVRRHLHAPVHLAGLATPDHGACLVFITRALDPARIAASYRNHVAAQPSETDARRADAA